MEDIPVIKHESKRIVTSCREGSRLGCVGQVSWRMMRVRIVQYTCCDEESIHEEEPAKHISTGCTLEVANKRTSALYAFPCLSARFSDSMAATINESRIRILSQRRWRMSLALRNVESENVVGRSNRERATPRKHACSTPSRWN